MRANIWIGYILGSVMVIVGALVLSGFLEFRGSGGEGGSMLRTVFGLVLLLYGIYRVAITETQRRRQERMR
jgi:uncharacterized membrane protein HdeD (DUF308 family)